MPGAAATLAAVMAIPAAGAAQDETAMVRVLHGAGDAPAADIYANGDHAGSDVEYPQMFDYIEVPGDTYQVTRSAMTTLERLGPR